MAIDHVVTSGTFSLDGGTWDVDNNVWLVGDEHEVIVIDAAHDLEKIASAIAGRRVVAVVCTHAHDDHVNQAPALSDRFDAPVYLHPAEAPLWAMAHPDRKPDHDLCDGDVLTAGGIELHAITTPGGSSGRSAAADSGTLSMPPSGKDSNSRPRSATRPSVVAKSITPATQAAVFSPML